jgi:hypothetical protein
MLVSRPDCSAVLAHETRRLIKSGAIGVGVSWGDGVLEYRGKKYPFTVEGLSVLDLGVSKVSAQGTVTNLKNLEDFNGNYALAATGGGQAPVRVWLRS